MLNLKVGGYRHLVALIGLSNRHYIFVMTALVLSLTTNDPTQGEKLVYCNPSFRFY